jgi:hypothetical protein
MFIENNVRDRLNQLMAAGPSIINIEWLQEAGILPIPDVKREDWELETALFLARVEAAQRGGIVVKRSNPPDERAYLEIIESGDLPLDPRVFVGPRPQGISAFGEFSLRTAFLRKEAILGMYYQKDQKFGDWCISCPNESLISARFAKGTAAIALSELVDNKVHIGEIVLMPKEDGLLALALNTKTNTYQIREDQQMSESSPISLRRPIVLKDDVAVTISEFKSQVGTVSCLFSYRGGGFQNNSFKVVVNTDLYEGPRIISFPQLALEGKQIEVVSEPDDLIRRVKIWASDIADRYAPKLVCVDKIYG